MPPSPQDIADRKLSLGLFLGIAAIIAIAGGAIFLFFGPAIMEATSSGIGLRTAAIIAFFLSLIVIIVMAITAGDGLIGELPGMLGGFFAFFVVSWLMIAWIF